MLWVVASSSMILGRCSFWVCFLFHSVGFSDSLLKQNDAFVCAFHEEQAYFVYLFLQPVLAIIITIFSSFLDGVLFLSLLLLDFICFSYIQVHSLEWWRWRKCAWMIGMPSPGQKTAEMMTILFCSLLIACYNEDLYEDNSASNFLAGNDLVRFV